jgi:parvulin-like peptidyl-prolyl isomerase
MLIRFFREKAAVIGWSIVIFFLATMFAGTFFMEDMFGGRSSEEVVDRHSLINAIAVIGDEALDPGMFHQALSQLSSQVDLEKTGGYMSPEMGEMIQYNAFTQAVNNFVLLGGSDAQNVKVSNREIEQALQSVLIQYDMKNKKQLRAFLKQKNMPYKVFKKSIKEMVQVQKFTRLLQDGIAVTNEDVDNQFVELNVRHILLRSTEKVDDGEREAMAQFVYEKLQEGMSFLEAVKTFSDDGGTKSKGGALGWLRAGQTVPEFEEVAYSLDVNSVSRPFKTVYGYHLVEVLGKRELDRPVDLDYDKMKDQILKQKKSGSVQSFIQSYLMDNPLDIRLPSLRAYKSKIEGDYERAIGEYQLLISESPYSPMPHFYIGRIYIMLEEYENALKELKKADIKAELNDSLSFPELHLALADVYFKKRFTKSMLAQYKKAVALANDNDVLLRQFLPILKERKVFKLRTKVQARIDEIVAARDLENEVLRAKLEAEEVVTSDAASAN